MAHGVWNAGFSRHTPPQAGGRQPLEPDVRARARDDPAFLRVEVLPPFGTPQLAHQKGPAPFDDELVNYRTLFTKLS